MGQTELILPAAPEGESPVDREGRGLQFHLESTGGIAESEASTPVADATSLADAAIQQLLQGVPPLEEGQEDKQDFALPARSLPPPKTGKTLEGTFPPPVDRPAPVRPEDQPLEVVQHAPEGEVPLAAQLSVSFSQPMVPIGSTTDLAAKGVPVQITPEVAGHWRWIGTKTLLFQPEKRFAMATRYEVEIPAGTASVTGSALKTAERWNFTTPAPRIVRSHPGGSALPLDPLMFVAFDQRIDPAAVLESIHLHAMNSTSQIPVHLATAAEVEDDAAARSMARDAGESRWLAFKSNEPLPAGTTFVVDVGPNTPSAEGPLKTDAVQSFQFATYGPLAIAEHRCGWGQECQPLTPWFIRFTNPLDVKSLEKSFGSITPELPGMKLEVHNDSLVIYGRSQGRTTYTVTLNTQIADQFGQTLAKPVELKFNVGKAQPVIWSALKPLTVLDPASKPSVSVYTVNHESLQLDVYAVEPSDFEQWVAYTRQPAMDPRRRGNQPPQQRVSIPGRRVISKVVQVANRPDELVETRIDLSGGLKDGLGQLVVVIQPTKMPVVNYRGEHVIRSWVQSTRIGLDAFADSSKLLAWTTSLLDGKPLAGVDVQIHPTSLKGASGEDGLTRIELREGPEAGPQALVARKGKDVAILVDDSVWWNENAIWQAYKPGNILRWYVVDDRKLYRPGEEVHVKGWLRQVGMGIGGDVQALGNKSDAISYRLVDSRGNEILQGECKIGALGGFDFAQALPSGMNLGQATFFLSAKQAQPPIGGGDFQHAIDVQEFRRPEFEVTTSASDGPYFVRSQTEVTVAASYYAGGPLGAAPVHWSVSTSPAHYAPPNWNDFSFGEWTPWWVFSADDMGGFRGRFHGRPGAENTTNFEGQTDGSGKHHLKLDFVEVTPPRPTTVSAQASVTDVNRQQWTSSTDLLVHPASAYVGLRAVKPFVQQGEPLIVDVIVPDIDGKAIENRDVTVRLVRYDWVYRNGNWREVEVDPEEQTVKSGVEPVRLTFHPQEGGAYRLKATVLDTLERPNQSELRLWVAGGKMPPSRDVTQQTVELIPNQKEYQPGDKAQILVRAPFFPAEGILTINRSGIVSSERFQMSEATKTLDIPIVESHIPNVHVQVDLVGGAPRTDDAENVNAKLPNRPAFAAGELNLSVPPRQRTLAVEVQPKAKSVAPGSRTGVEVTVRKADGQPAAGSEVALIVVDEAVLALTSYKLPNPLSVFYEQREAGIRAWHDRMYVLLTNPDDLLAGVNDARSMPTPMEAAAPAAADGFGFFGDRMETRSLLAAKSRGPGGGAGQVPIVIRKDFNPLAAFVPSVMTDAEGRATVEVEMPDNLTRYRVMAIAVAGDHDFGTGESNLTARLPLMVRPSPPRFLNYGDRFELPIVVQNQLEEPLDIDLAAVATNAVFTEGSGRRLTVAGGERVEVRLPAAAAQPGTARFQIVARSGEWSDAAQIELPVWTPATTEAFATYGEIDDQTPLVQKVLAPSDVVTQFGGLEVTTSSTAVASLTDAVLYLVRYPYECAEQISSRVLAVAALRDVLTAFKADGLPPAEELITSVQKDMDALVGLQNPDGGYGFWRRYEESWPFLSIHVGHAFARARQKDFTVPEETLTLLMGYLRTIDQRIPERYSVEVRRALKSYALYVRKLLGDDCAAEAANIVREAGVDNLSLESNGWLLAVMTGSQGMDREIAAIRRHLMNRATQTAEAANFTSSYGDGNYVLLYSDRRADGVILDALISDQPDNELIPKVVRGLLAHRKAGHWLNTQENAFVLLALDRYFNTYERESPDFLAQAWLGDKFALEHQFQGRSTDRYHVTIPLALLGNAGTATDLIMEKQGAGRLYYRLGMRYAPQDLELKAADYGFTVDRRYESIDKPDDVRRGEDGAWHIRPGAKVRVRLTMVAPSRRYHVALVDPLPAGLEAQNPALAVTARPAPDQRTAKPQGWWFPWTWFEHQNLRDDRVEAFSSLVWGGVYEYTYEARATTPGTFVVPPTKAEEMYAPETFGRGQTDRVIIE